MEIIEKDGRKILVDDIILKIEREKKNINRAIEEKFNKDFYNYIDKYYYESAKNKGFSFPSDFADGVGVYDKFLIFHDGLDFKTFIREKLGEPSKEISPEFDPVEEEIGFWEESLGDKEIDLNLTHEIKEKMKMERIDYILNREQQQGWDKSMFYDKLKEKYSNLIEKEL